jgi:hypothetical protein
LRVGPHKQQRLEGWSCGKEGEHQCWGWVSVLVRKAAQRTFASAEWVSTPRAAQEPISKEWALLLVDVHQSR